MFPELIEQRTSISLEQGELSIFKTTRPCADLVFNFEKPVLTMMLSGQKFIGWQTHVFELSPTSLFIPPPNQDTVVTIKHASHWAPNICLVLELSEDLLVDVHYEISEKWQQPWQQRDLAHSKTDPYFLSHDQMLLKSYSKLYQTVFNQEERSDFLLNLNLKELIFLLFRRPESRNILFQKEVITSEPLQAAIHYIEHHFREDIPITVLASTTNMSKASFYKKFKQHQGCSPNDFIKEKRIAYAQTLLETTNLAINAVAHESGFNSVEHFCRVFKKSKGVSAQQYRLGN